MQRNEFCTMYIKLLFIEPYIPRNKLFVMNSSRVKKYFVHDVSLAFTCLLIFCFFQVIQATSSAGFELTGGLGDEPPPQPS